MFRYTTSFEESMSHLKINHIQDIFLDNSSKAYLKFSSMGTMESTVRSKTLVKGKVLTL